MKFVDSLKIKVKAGNGGNGCVSFRREKYVPRGGPDGGNGGRGGDIIIIGDNSKHTLLDLHYMNVYEASNGERGRGKDQHGKHGDDLNIKVPLGTIVINDETDEIIADIVDNNQEVVAARGGRGGKGNICFTTSSQRAPRFAETGTPGEEIEIRLELKVIADVGVIGFPNAGKSTFISVVSAAKPKIADYPFTTLNPNLGVVKGEYGNSFVIADMPGLIEGAHLGAGLGIKFLRHIERAKILLHLLDSSEESSLIERYQKIRNELNKYSETLSKKPEIIAVSKIDSIIDENVEEFSKFISEQHPNTKLFLVSSITNDGIKTLIEHITEELKNFDEKII